MNFAKIRLPAKFPEAGFLTAVFILSSQSNLVSLKRHYLSRIVLSGIFKTLAQYCCGSYAQFVNILIIVRQIFGEIVPYSTMRVFVISLALSVACGCTAWQPTKEVWKTTKGLWYTYVSPPASVDYDDKGSVQSEGLALSSAIMGIDVELDKLERAMQNADKPPTQEWLTSLFASFPWLNGFAGVKYDGTILGQEPPDSLKKLDFIPLLYEDKKQGSRALRADAQPGPLGPEIILATPLYDGIDFLGIVAAYFDMRSLMRFSNNANAIVVLTPGALLWPGKYDFAATPLAGVDWNKVVLESTSGTCSNSTGAFYYMVRYLGNLPMIFAIPSKGTFPDGNGSLEQGNSYFPQERKKLAPPPIPERKPESEARIPAFEKAVEPEPEPQPAAVQPMPEASDKNVIRQGSHESMLLRKRQQQKRRHIQERQLEGPNIEYRPTREPRKDNGPALDLIPDSNGPKLPGGRPSPFGPKNTHPAEDKAQPAISGNEDKNNEKLPETSTSPKSTPAPVVQPAMTAGEKGPENPDTTTEETTTPAPKASTESADDKSAKTTPNPEMKSMGTPQSSVTDAEKGAVSSKTTGEEADNSVPKKPATLPGGRPSPFGPRN